MTTPAAIASVCMLRAVDVVAANLNMTWALIAGSHLGAGLHGGPIPWDDDSDIIIDFDRKQEFVDGIKSFKIDNKTIFHIFQGSNSVKMCVLDESYTPLDTPKDKNASVLWRFPYLDIFLFRRNFIVEVGRRRLGPRKSWPANVFERIRPYFFGGLMLPGLPWDAAIAHYNLSVCVVASSSHRGLHHSYNRHHGQLNCCELTKHFPFIYRIPSQSSPTLMLEVVVIDRRPLYLTIVKAAEDLNGPDRVMEHGYIVDRKNRQIGIATKSSVLLPRRLFRSKETGLGQWLPSHAWNTDFVDNIWGAYSTASRREDMRTSTATGSELTRSIPDLDAVELDNSIASVDNNICHRIHSNQRDHGTELKVLVYNGKRGAAWFEFATKVRHLPQLDRPDVILLTEMDVGMARSGNLHTTRLLAHALGMNYAWGLEFIELTNGNEKEQVNLNEVFAVKCL
jgi:hypothetical protein